MSKLFLTRIFLLRVYDEKPPRKLLAVAQGIAVLLGLPELPRVLAQSSATDWERIVGGKAPFDVASVKRNVGSDGSNPDAALTGVGRTHVPWFGDAYPPNGGLFNVEDTSILMYIAFAYKLSTQQDGGSTSLYR